MLKTKKVEKEKNFFELEKRIQLNDFERIV